MQLAHEREIWLVTGSQQIYGDDEMQTVAATARVAAETLNSAEGMDPNIVPGPVATTGEAVRHLCRQANSNPRCIGIIFQIHTFAPARMWPTNLGELKKPVCFLHNQPGRLIPRATGHHRVTTIVGHLADRGVVLALVDWSRAAIAAQEYRSLVIAGFGATRSEESEAGVRVEAIDSSTLAEEIKSISGDQIGELVDRYQEHYSVAQELRPGGDQAEALRNQARLELAIGQMLREGGYGGVTATRGIVSGIALQRLMAAGYGFGPDGDYQTAALVRALKSAGNGPGGTTFLEDTTYVRHASTVAAFGPHMLELCPTVANHDVTPRVEAATLGPNSGSPRLVFAPAPGSGINIGLATIAGRPLLVANSVYVDLPPADREASSVPDIFIQPRPDAATASECWKLAGSVRYTALSTNIPFHVLETFAGILGFGFAGIGSGSTVRAFRRQLRGVRREFS